MIGICFDPEICGEAETFSKKSYFRKTTLVRKEI